MLSKMQKIWLGIFGAMFLIPEILFSTTASLIASIGGESFYKINSLIVNYRVFFDYPYYLLLIIIIEWVGILGLIVLTLKSNRKILAIFPFLFLLWLSYIFILVYVTGVSMIL